MGGRFYWVARVYRPPNFASGGEVVMLSRLVILGVLREVAEHLERKGMASWVVQAFSDQAVEALFQKCDTVEATRVLEDRLGVIVRDALKRAEEIL